LRRSGFAGAERFLAVPFSHPAPSSKLGEERREAGVLWIIPSGSVFPRLALLQGLRRLLAEAFSRHPRFFLVYQTEAGFLRGITLRVLLTSMA